MVGYEVKTRVQNIRRQRQQLENDQAQQAWSKDKLVLTLEKIPK